MVCRCGAAPDWSADDPTAKPGYLPGPASPLWEALHGGACAEADRAWIVICAVSGRCGKKHAFVDTADHPCYSIRCLVSSGHRGAAAGRSCVAGGALCAAGAVAALFLPSPCTSLFCLPWDDGPSVVMDALLRSRGMYSRVVCSWRARLGGMVMLRIGLGDTEQNTAGTRTQSHVKGGLHTHHTGWAAARPSVCGHAVRDMRLDWRCGERLKTVSAKAYPCRERIYRMVDPWRGQVLSDMCPCRRSPTCATRVALAVARHLSSRSWSWCGAVNLISAHRPTWTGSQSPAAHLGRLHA